MTEDIHIDIRDEEIESWNDRNENENKANLYRTNSNYGGAIYFVKDNDNQSQNLAQTQQFSRDDFKRSGTINLPTLNNMSIANSTIKNEGERNKPEKTELFSLMKDIDNLVEQMKTRQKN